MTGLDYPILSSPAGALCNAASLLSYGRAAPMVSSEVGMDKTHPRCHQPAVAKGIIQTSGTWLLAFRNSSCSLLAALALTFLAARV